MGRLLKRTFARLRKLHPRFHRWLLRCDVERFLTFGYIARTPQRQLTVGYLCYALLGALVLCLPVCTACDTSPLDNLFTSVSAVSTTGLSTVDVARSYTFTGQLVILLLIQLGGIGYMTLSTFVMYRVTHHFLGMHGKTFRTQFALPAEIRPERLVGGIVRYTFFFEAAGAAVLYLLLRADGAPQPVWSAVFHSVSSFCTAGFSIYSDNLVRFAANVPVNFTIMILSYAGAMGFIVLSDLWQKAVRRHYRITFTTKVILAVTLIVTVWGTVHLFFFDPSLAASGAGDRLMAALFQTMSAMTTVGYNTVDVGRMAPISLLVLAGVMYVGASPSGTGGGLKSTTVSAVFAYVKCRLGLRDEVTLWGRKIPSYRIYDALTIFVFYTAILFCGTYLLTLAQSRGTDFLYLMFEAASALGTVGLSSGVSFHLTAAGKIILILLMYVGRVGVLTIGTALLVRLKTEKEILRRDDLAV